VAARQLALRRELLISALVQYRAHSISTPCTRDTDHRRVVRLPRQAKCHSSSRSHLFTQLLLQPRPFPLPFLSLLCSILRNSYRPFLFSSLASLLDYASRSPPLIHLSIPPRRQRSSPLHLLQPRLDQLAPHALLHQQVRQQNHRRRAHDLHQSRRRSVWDDGGDRSRRETPSTC
jgi:hypothetical protein